MAGLIVIDFIDMEQSSHVRKVEKAMKEALKNDRARIQVGRISSFGLMEMSRQRLRTGVLEASTKPCPHCDGTGLMRTAASAGLSALRILEDEAARGRGDRICLRAGKEAAIYVLNKKRTELADIEHRYGVGIEVLVDESFEGARMTVDSSGPRPVIAPRAEPAAVELDDEPVEEEFDEELEDEAADEAVDVSEPASDSERQARRRRRRRRGGRGRRREGGEPLETGEAAAAEAPQEPVGVAAVPASADDSPGEERPGGRRRRRRRGRGGGADRAGGAEATPIGVDDTPAPVAAPFVEQPISLEPPIEEAQAQEEPQPKKRGRRKKPAAEPDAVAAEPESAPSKAEAVTASEAPSPALSDAAPAAKPARKRRSKKADAAVQPSPEESLAVPAANNDTVDDATGEPRRGWWQRTFG